MDDIGRLIAMATAAESAQKEKHQAFNALVKRFQDLAFGCAYAILADFQLAKDAALESFVGKVAAPPTSHTGRFLRHVLPQVRS